MMRTPRNSTLAWFVAASAMALASPVLGSEPAKITPGAIWPDDRGQHIQAHGGGVVKHGDAYYWFGEDRSRDLPRDLRAVACYSSTDLVHWTFRSRAFQMSTGHEATPPIANRPKGFPDWRLVLERPKVFPNARTGKFVMYMHLDGAEEPGGPNYRQARVGVAVADKIEGPYSFVTHFRPLKHESRDIGQFIDDDGTAYLIYEDRPVGFHIAKLSDDYLTVLEDVTTIKAPIEGGALVHYDGLYYMIGSWLTGWTPNNNVYATSKSLAGPWTKFKDVAPPESNTFNSQSTMMLKVVGTKTTTVIFMADMWKPEAQWDSRYLWMPMEIGDGKLQLPEPRPWTLDVATGEAVIDHNAPAMPYKTGKPHRVVSTDE
ncbi:family 43 glycosylhydrolase [Paludisphaera rhizosphaerae]|uniref:family 43 glycosylhydrolase n=1 Tax=Paludisphaera rhizosphaerae TaxID=2711216 RepID=UPI00197D04A8|nr:family 43 glycosylhydrolase [Paludisphaera rhizosphaerae]